MRGPELTWGFDVRVGTGTEPNSWCQYYCVAGTDIEAAKKTLADRVKYHNGDHPFEIIAATEIGAR